MILPIEVVAIQADLIVTGEIISTQDSLYSFKVDDYIKGSDETIITVEKFSEWICDTRYQKVQIGERLILFLKRLEGKFEIINGSTGEIPIINNMVTLANESNRRSNMYDEPYSMYAPEFTDGIRKFVKYFSIKYSTLIQKCTNNEMNSFRVTSDFTSWLYKKLMINYLFDK